MNQREKLLAGLVGLLAVCLAAYLVYSRASTALTRRHATLTNLHQSLQEQEQKLRQAERANQRLRDYQARSLPVDVERSNSLYQQWLLNQVDRCGFRDPSVSVADRRFSGGYFSQSRFDITGEATLLQLANFLNTFYRSDDLHRIHQLTVSPIADSRHLDILIGIEAISVPGSSRSTVGDLVDQNRSDDDMDAVRAAILKRSMFFPHNQPPKIASVGQQRVAKGQSWRVQVKATDPDPWDTIEYRFADTPPEGVELKQSDDNFAALTWTPLNTGEFTFDLIAADQGHPPAEDRVTIRVTVTDPPPATDEIPRFVGFDDATQTFLVGTVTTGKAHEAWFNIRTKGQLLKLSLGDSLVVGSVVGEISRIEERSVEIGTPDGTLHIQIGQNLSEATPTTPPSRQADSRS